MLLAPTATAAEPGPLGKPGDILTMPIANAVKVLDEADEQRTGYQRTSFKHWIDANKDGCNTRAEVLKREAFITPHITGRCTITAGEWYSAYDNTYLDDAGKLDIDHLVPLAEAWDSGAGTWTAAEREAYANDIGDDRSLIAVSAKTNRSKADQDPATWLPPFAGDRCQYVTDWVATKMRWQLAIDPAEKAELLDDLAQCPNKPVKITLAR
ncbi:HNH endonuclease family protein [Streptomyces sp. NPDC057694]|uniref:HNH endonuclease family protein n=1 Tax=Streptomyces sp. NPDC057694 TaxID=3346216 RepID=UPI003693C5D5